MLFSMYVCIVWALIDIVCIYLIPTLACFLAPWQGIRYWCKEQGYKGRYRDGVLKTDWVYVCKSAKRLEFYLNSIAITLKAMKELVPTEI